MIRTELKQRLAIASIRLLLFMSCMTNHVVVHAQEIKTSSKLSSQEIVIGDPIKLTYSVTFDPQKYRVQLPRIPDTFHHFEMVSREKIDTNTTRESITLSQENVVTNFDSGRWLIPSHAFRVQPLNGNDVFDLKSDSFVVNVNTVAVDTSKPIKPIFDIIAAQAPWWEKPLYFLVAFLALALIIGIIYYYRKYIRKANVKPKKSLMVLSPWEKASVELQLLEDKKLWLQGLAKEHQTEITDIIRRYLEETLGLDCFEKTSQEIITDVKKSLQARKFKNRGAELDRLRELFAMADLVKFAKSHPSEEEHKLAIQRALSFVTSTRSFFIEEIKQAEAKKGEPKNE